MSAPRPGHCKTCSCPPACGWPTCDETAAYEGWARKVDPFTQEPTGMMLLIKACESHKHGLLGFQTGERSDSERT